MAAPYQVKFCYALQKHYDAEFWFYVRRESDRPKWWEIPLGDKCKVMKWSGVFPRIGYYSFGVFFELLRFRPHIIMLGGFMKWHWIILKIAKLFNKKVIIMTEPIRYVSSDSDTSQVLMSKENAPKSLEKIKSAFKAADLFVGMGSVAKEQLRKEFEFNEEKVTSIQYPQDIEAYFNHPLRQEKQKQDYTILFANRLIDRYQPIFALEVFKRLKEKYPNIKLLMNNDGPLKGQCLSYIGYNELKDVEFLQEIDSWNNMHEVYKKADILILPATYSNGNMSIIEAAASGMGIVISNQINHVDKFARNGENCYICDLNIESFVDAIENYIEKPSIFAEYGCEVRKLVEGLKNENVAMKYVEMFERHGV